MTGFGMYKGEKFQDEQRQKLLKFMNIMIHGEEVAVMYAGMCAEALYDGMNPFRDQLDLHNRCLLLNAKYQSDKIFKELEMRRVERIREINKDMNKVIK